MELFPFRPNLDSQLMVKEQHQLGKGKLLITMEFLCCVINIVTHIRTSEQKNTVLSFSQLWYDIASNRIGLKNKELSVQHTNHDVFIRFAQWIYNPVIEGNPLPHCSKCSLET